MSLDKYLWLHVGLVYSPVISSNWWVISDQLMDKKTHTAHHILEKCLFLVFPSVGLGVEPGSPGHVTNHLTSSCTVQTGKTVTSSCLTQSTGVSGFGSFGWRLNFRVFRMIRLWLITVVLLFLTCSRSNRWIRRTTADILKRTGVRTNTTDGRVHPGTSAQDSGGVCADRSQQVSVCSTRVHWPLTSGFWTACCEPGSGASPAVMLAVSIS